MKKEHFLFYLILSFLLINLSGCDSGSQVILPPLQKSTATILSEKGLSTDFLDNTIHLNIPANAVETDTDIKLTVLEKSNGPDPEKTATDLYLFESDAFTLLQPAELHISIQSEIPANHSIFIAKLENGIWINNPTSILNDNKAITSISTFVAYALRIVENKLQFAREDNWCAIEEEMSPFGPIKVRVSLRG